MSITHDKKAAKKAVETLRRFEKKLVGEDKADYLKALDLMARYNVSLRQARPTETIITKDTAQIDQLTAKVQDLENQLEQNRRQLEREKNRPIDFDSDDVFQAFQDWIKRKTNTQHPLDYAQASVVYSAEMFVRLVGGRLEESEVNQRLASAIVVHFCIEMAKHLKPSMAQEIGRIAERLESNNPDFRGTSQIAIQSALGQSSMGLSDPNLFTSVPS